MLNAETLGGAAAILLAVSIIIIPGYLIDRHDRQEARAEARAEAAYRQRMTPLEKLLDRASSLACPSVQAPEAHDRAAVLACRRGSAVEKLIEDNEGHVPDAALIGEAESLLARPLLEFERADDLWTAAGRQRAAIASARAED